MRRGLRLFLWFLYIVVVKIEIKLEEGCFSYTVHIVCLSHFATFIMQMYNSNSDVQASLF